MKISKKLSVSLPVSVIDRLDSIGLTKSEYNHSLHFLKILIGKSFKEHGLIDMPIELSSSYLRTVFSPHYLSWLNKLKNAQIIITNNYYNINNNISKSYNINTSPLLLLISDSTKCKTVSYEYKKNKEKTTDFNMENNVFTDLNKLKINKPKLKKLIEKTVMGVDLKDFTIGKDIIRENLGVYFKFNEGKYKKYFMPLENALKKAEELNMTLIQDVDSFYIMDWNEFINRKRIAMAVSYMDSLQNLHSGYYYAKRNETNNRLDTNITSMTKTLTSEIFKDSNLVQLDLSNSQFAILSNMLEDRLDTDDFKVFKEQSYTGTLYEYIMDKFSIKKRSVVKKMLFELMFSKETNNSPLKKKLRELFPSVVDEVDSFKKEHGYNSFSIMLQKKESEIFIDGLWKMVKKRGLFCLTKHDCLVVRREEANLILKIITDYFNKIGFKGKVVKDN